jgi:hypothetical protein
MGVFKTGTNACFGQSWGYFGHANKVQDTDTGDDAPMISVYFHGADSTEEVLLTTGYADSPGGTLYFPNRIQTGLGTAGQEDSQDNTGQSSGQCFISTTIGGFSGTDWTLMLGTGLQKEENWESDDGTLNTSTYKNGVGVTHANQRNHNFLCIGKP